MGNKRKGNSNHIFMKNQCSAGVVSHADKCLMYLKVDLVTLHCKSIYTWIYSRIIKVLFKIPSLFSLIRINFQA